MTSKASPAGARIAGLIAGLVLVASVAWSTWRVPVSASPPTVGVAVKLAPDGSVKVDVPGDVVRSPALGRGAGEAGGLFHMRNLTGQRLAVRPQLAGGDAEVAQVLHVELTRRGRVVYSGPAAELRGGVARAVLLPPRGLAALRVRAWVDGDVTPSLAGRDARWRLTLSGEPA
jgi:hypothetical protein